MAEAGKPTAHWRQEKGVWRILHWILCAALMAVIILIMPIVLALALLDLALGGLLRRRIT